MTAKRIFISGGAGVIGKQLVPILESAGHEVIVADLKQKPREFSSSVDYLCGDLNNLSHTQFNSLNIDIVIHLAATFERTDESLDFWGDSFQNNVLLSHHLVDICKNTDSVKRVVFASSYLVYDSLQYLTTDSQNPVSLDCDSKKAPRNLIGASKLYHEAELEYLARFDEIGFTVVIARIFRGYGIDSRDVISRWVRDAIKGNTIKVFNDVGSFDYTYCKDSAQGLAKLAVETEFAGVVNLGSGKSRTVSEVVMILKSYFPHLQVSHLGNHFPVEASRANIAKLESILNWSPQFSLEDGIGEIVAHELKAFKGIALDEKPD